MTHIAPLISSLIRSVSSDPSIPEGVLMLRGSEVWSAFHIATGCLAHGQTKESALRLLGARIEEFRGEVPALPERARARGRR